MRHKQCQVCGGLLQGRQRAFCSPACRKRQLAYQYRAKRRYLHRHRYQCETCGVSLRVGRPPKYP